MGLKERDAQRFNSKESEKVLVDRPPVPRNMMVELTNGCNHACIFCTNAYMTRRVGRIELSLLSRVMREARALGVTEIGFYTTGDPFVHSGLVDITREATSLGFEYKYISTNGALASPERSKAVIDAGMSSIKFSINAGSRDTYRLIHGRDDWDTVVRNLEFIAEYRKTNNIPLFLAMTCVVTEPIKHETASIEERFSPIVDEIYFSDCTDQISQMRSALPLLGFPEASQRTAQGTEVCRLPFTRMHVTREGYLTLCCVDYQNYLAVADLNVLSLEEAWNSEEFAVQRRRHLNRHLEGTLCNNCWNGACDQISPLNDRFATKYSTDEFGLRISEQTSERFL